MCRCKKCRRKLATQFNLLEHDYGSEQLAFRWHKREDLGLVPKVHHGGGAEHMVRVCALR